MTARVVSLTAFRERTRHHGGVLVSIPHLVSKLGAEAFGVWTYAIGARTPQGVMHGSIAAHATELGLTTARTNLLLQKLEKAHLIIPRWRDAPGTDVLGPDDGPRAEAARERVDALLAADPYHFSGRSVFGYYDEASQDAWVPYATASWIQTTKCTGGR